MHVVCDAGGAPKKKKYGAWLQHHGDHTPQKKPASKTTTESTSVKQLLTKLENTLKGQGDESLDSQQTGGDRKNVIDGLGSDNYSAPPTSPPTASPLQRLRSMRKKMQLPKDVGTSMFDTEWSVIQSSISGEEKKNFTVLTYGERTVSLSVNLSACLSVSLVVCQICLSGCVVFTVALPVCP